MDASSAAGATRPGDVVPAERAPKPSPNRRRSLAGGAVVGLLVLGGLAVAGALFSSQPAATNQVAAASCFYLPNVQSGSVAVTASGTTTVSISAVDASHAFLLFSSSADSVRPTAGQIGGRIASATSLEFVRVTDAVTPEPASVLVTWTVVEYPCGVSVQRGTATISSATTDVSVSPLDSTTQGFATVSSTGAATETTWVADGDDLVSARLTTTSNLRLQTAVAPAAAHTAYWQVVSFVDPTMMSVQSGSTTLAVGTSSVTANLTSAAPVGSSFVVASSRGGVPGGTSDAASGLVQTRLLDSTRISFDRGASNYSTTVEWQVVTLNDGTAVQSGTASMAAGTTSVSSTLVSPVVVNRVSVFLTTATSAGLSGGQTSYLADDNTGVAAALADTDTATTIRLARLSGTASASFAWQVVDWGRRRSSAVSSAVPAAPTAVTAGAVSSSSVVVGWTAPVVPSGAPVTDYVVDWRTSPSGSWTTFADGTSAATSATLTGLSGASTYDVRVTAVNANGSSVASATVQVVVTTTPSAPTAATASNYSVAAFVGSGTSAQTDGTGSAASFRHPEGIAVDSAGNLFIADQTANAIRKVTPAGVVTTFAGSTTSVAGASNGTGTAAKFNNPIGVAIDASDVLYVSDYGNNLIRKITPAGVVSTFAGSGAAATTNGTGTAAAFKGPDGIAVDGGGNVYVAETSSGAVRKITAAAVVTTLATIGTSVTDVVPLPDGSLYVSSYSQNLVAKVTQAGVVTTVLTPAGPVGMSRDPVGNLYVVTPYAVYRYDTNLTRTLLVGTGSAGSSDGTASAASYNFVQFVRWSTGNVLYTSEYNAYKIRRATPVGSGSVSLAWSTPATNGGLAISDYVVEYRTSPSGSWTTYADGVGTTTSATVVGLVDGTTYDFRVSAVNSIGTGPASAAVTTTPSWVPTAPTGLAVTASSGQLAASWTAPSSDGGSTIQDYLVEYKLSSASIWTTFNDGVGTGTSVTITGLTNGSSYDVRVTAGNANGPSAVSNVATSYVGDAMTITVDTTLLGSRTVGLPLRNNVGLNIDWGVTPAPAGCPTTVVSANLGTDTSCTYAADGTYTVRLTGTLATFGSGAAYSGAAGITAVTSWGTLPITSLSGAFFGATNLTSVPTSIPTGVTNLTNTFYGATAFNSSAVSTWNTANVTTMNQTFRGATAFNQSLSGWNTANVTNMSSMFNTASSFDQNIVAWNTGNVTNMSSMFYFASSFNRNLGAIGASWNTSKVTNMSSMFQSATLFNGDVSQWDVSKVTNLSNMFYGAAAFNGDLHLWNTANVTTMSGLFLNATSFSQDISGWNTAKVTTFRQAFRGATAFNQPIGSWNVSAATDFSLMFYAETVFNQPLGAWSTGNVTTMMQMFYGATAFNQPIGTWDVSKVNDMSSMFYGATAFNQNLNTWSTGAVTTMYAMFRQATAFNGAIGSWNTAAVTNFSYMFASASVFNQNIGSWNTSAATTMMYMFGGASAFNQNIGSWNTAFVTNMSYMFYYAVSFNGSIGSWNTGAVTTMSNMFTYDQVFNQNIGSWNTGALTNATYMFNGASAFNQNIGSWNTSSLTNMGSMFSGASAFNQNIGSWNTTAVVDMSYVFYSAVAFNQNITGWNTANVVNMSYMFYNARAFNQAVGTWLTGSVTNMNSTFQSATAFNADLSRWCVSAFASEPSNFSLNTTAWTAAKPVWGSCPAPPTPTAVAATAGDGQTSVSWSAAAMNGGAATTGYLATATATGQTTRTCTTTTATTCTISTLANGATYTVTVVATGASGNSASSAGVSVVPYPSSILASSLTNLWLDAADASSITTVSGAVSQWSDKSPGGQSVTQSTAAQRPAYVAGQINGLPVVRLTPAANTYLTRSGATLPTGANAWSWFVVSRSGSNSSELLGWGTNAASGKRFGFWYAVTGGIGLESVNNGMTSSTRTWSASASLVSGVYSGGTLSNYSQWYNGTPDALTGQTTFTPSVPSGGQELKIGGIPTVSSGFTPASDVAEIVVLNGAATATQRRAIDEYLATKWGLTIAPAAPLGIGASGSGGSATVTWTAPNNGGAAVSGYTVTATSSGRTTRTCTTTGATTCSLSGLTVGATYTIAVTATNSIGTGDSGTTTFTA